MYSRSELLSVFFFEKVPSAAGNGAQSNLKIRSVVGPNTTYHHPVRHNTDTVSP